MAPAKLARSPVLEASLFLLLSFTLAYLLDYIVYAGSGEAPESRGFLIVRVMIPLLAGWLVLAAAGYRPASLMDIASSEMLVRVPRGRGWGNAILVPVMLVVLAYSLALVFARLLGYEYCRPLLGSTLRMISEAFPFFLLASAASITANFLLALPDEAGWRGLLYTRLQRLGLNVYAIGVASGLLWGLWYAPLAYYGFFYQETAYMDCTIPGVAGMDAVKAYLAYSTGLGLMLTLLVDRYQTVISAAMARGTAYMTGALASTVFTGAQTSLPPYGTLPAISLAIVTLAWYLATGGSQGRAS